MAITNPSKSCRAESDSGWLRCSHSEHDDDTPHRFDVVTATGQPIPQRRGSGLPVFDQLIGQTFG